MTCLNVEILDKLILYFQNLDNASLQFNVILVIIVFIMLLVYYIFEYSFSYDKNLITPNIRGTLNYISNVSNYIERNHTDDSSVTLKGLLENNDSTNLTNENEVLFMLDPYGNIIYANDITLMIFDKKIEELLGTSIFTEYKTLGVTDHSWFDESRKNRKSFNVIKLTYHNEERLLLMSYRPTFDSFNRLESIIVTGSDMTKLIKLDTIKDFYQKIDHTTGLINQYGMLEKIREMKNTESAICFFIDALHFSDITGYYGQEVSDELIKKISSDLKSIVGDKGLLARYSNSRFVLMFFNGPIDDLQVSSYTSKIIEFLYKPYRVKNQDIQVDRRVGYSIYPTDSNSLEEVISLSSIALTDAINRNNIFVNRYKKNMLDNLRYNLELSSKLKQAIINEDIQVYFQKAVDCKNNSTFVFEELARWNDKDLGYISPLDFFRVAKETNQLEDLDKYMVEKSLLKFKKLRETNQEFKNSKVTINLSPGSLLSISFFSFFDQKVKEVGLKPSDIFIEISEGTFINKLELCINRINKYKHSGYLIALDDFGIEYSSLAVLEKVNYDVIKLDQSFVKNMHKPNNLEIIKMIRKITELSSKEVIAEGVETSEQCEMLVSLGCNIQQGYLHHKPENITL